MSISQLYLSELTARMPVELKSEYQVVSGASQAEIAQLVESFPNCPLELIDLLEQVNGTYYQTYGEQTVSLPILGSDVEAYPYYLKSVQQILADQDVSYMQDSLTERYGEWIEKQYVTIDHKIDATRPRKDWLCFADCINNGGTSSLYVDFHPTATGTVGQVIRYLHDPDSYLVIAESFEEYLTQVMQEGFLFTEIYEDWE